MRTVDKTETYIPPASLYLGICRITPGGCVGKSSLRAWGNIYPNKVLDIFLQIMGWSDAGYIDEYAIILFATGLGKISFTRATQ